MKILCIGEALIDMICTDKGSSLSKGQNFLKKPGGAPTNVAAAVAALGGEVELAAKVGKDPFGKCGPGGSALLSTGCRHALVCFSRNGKTCAGSLWSLVPGIYGFTWRLDRQRP